MRRLRSLFSSNFTERNPVVIGAVAVVLIAAFVVSAITLNKNILGGGVGVTARFSNAAGLRSGDQVLMAGVPIGTVVSLDERGAYIYAHLRVGGSVQIPADSSATIEVETLLGQLAVKVVAGQDWSRLLRAGATITATTVPVEFQQLQNATGPLLAQSNGPALNQLLGDLASVTKDKQAQVASIISGLDKLTSTVNQRQAQVSELIDASNQVAGALASRDQQLVTTIDNFDTVLAGLSQRRADISALIRNTEAAANQTASLVGANRARLDDLLNNLQADLNVVAAHQIDLAQGVSYLASAIQGFASIGYSGPSEYPNSWANIYTNLLNGGDAVYGPCGYLDQALDAALGPDPTPCANRAGPQTTSASTVAGGSASAVITTDSYNSGGGALRSILDSLMGVG
ncbi:MAG TPA: MCE family protein [Acidimicrobiales bacterium]|nr:MCE family protein [Acidimicrobiales bacterium]